MRRSRAIAALCFVLAAAVVLAQHEHHAMSSQAQLKSESPDPRHMTILIGPVKLAAGATHDAVPQPPTLFFVVPEEAWIVAYHPTLVDAGGAPLAGKLLHHVAFYNTARSDFLCPNKEEHIFGAGGEMNDWPRVPGFGYRVHKGDRIRVSTMFHNPTPRSHSDTYLKVEMELEPASGGELKNVYPAWFDVNECRESAFDLVPGKQTRTGKITVPVNATLLGVGGHLHDYGEALVLANSTRKETVATLQAKKDANGILLAMPVELFVQRGGYALHTGEVIETTATYNNVTSRNLPSGAMGIVVGYIVPQNDAEMQAFARDTPVTGEHAH